MAFGVRTIVVVSALCIGCASFPTPPSHPIGAVLGTRAGLADDRPPRGALRAGDELIVGVTSGALGYRRKALVDARGDVHVASGQDVAVAGLPLEQAEARVAHAVQQSDKAAEVDLSLSPAQHPRVSALGALKKPGYLVLTPGMRVIDLVAAAGGILTAKGATGALPLQVADLEASVLVRDGVALPISLREALLGKVGHNVYLQPGDQLYIPLATDHTVSVLGQVGRPGMLMHRSGMRLTEALSEAGGIRSGGDKGDIRLVRGTIEAPKVYRASLSAIADGKGKDVALIPGDVLFVTDHRMEDVGEVVQLLLPLGMIALAVLTVAFIATQ